MTSALKSVAVIFKGGSTASLGVKTGEKMMWLEKISLSLQFYRAIFLTLISTSEEEGNWIQLQVSSLYFQYVCIFNAWESLMET